MRAAITGIGAVSGFGLGADPLWRALVEGKRAMERRAGFDVGPLALAPFSLDDPARVHAMANAAVEEALADAGDLPRTKMGVTVGTTLGGISAWLPSLRGGEIGGDWEYGAIARVIARSVGAQGPVETLSVACASGNAALGSALDLIRMGRCDVVIAGGADALNDFVVSGFASLKALDPEPCRPFDRTRRGLNLGEGAAFLVLESETHARARGARIRAFLDGYGIAADAVHMTGPDREGRGAARAMKAALDEAGVSEVDFVSAHGTATVFNDLMESKALSLALGARAGQVPLNSVKSALGHTLGAAGALEAIVCVRTLETGTVAPTPGLVDRDPEIALDVVHDRARNVDVKVALSTSSGFGGTNAAIVLSRARSET